MSGVPIKILVIGHVWPEPSATAAGRRMVQLIQCFKDFGAEVVFASAAARSEFSQDLKELGIPEHAILLNDTRFDHFIKDQHPDVVVFDRFMTEEQYGWRVAEQLPSALRILNTEDLHSLRAVRGLAQKEGRKFDVRDWLQSEIAKRELASLYRSDISLIISKYEIALLREEANIPNELLYYLPFLYEEQEMAEDLGIHDYEKREDFVFIGNGKHLPNLDAIQWLKEEIWPEIRTEISGASLHIYGALFKT